MPAINQRLLNESTEVLASTSATEIGRELVTIGATAVEMRYANGHITGLSWSMPVNGSPAYFTMPARVEGVLGILIGRQRGYVTEGRKKELYLRAERIAWRHLYRWVQAQVAMVRTTMLQPAEPFIPFATVPGQSRTLYEIFAERGRLMAPEVKH